jgi:hypothetical protein
MLMMVLPLLGLEAAFVQRAIHTVHTSNSNIQQALVCGLCVHRQHGFGILRQCVKNVAVLENAACKAGKAGAAQCVKVQCVFWLWAGLGWDLHICLCVHTATPTAQQLLQDGTGTALLLFGQFVLFDCSCVVELQCDHLAFSVVYLVL